MTAPEFSRVVRIDAIGEPPRAMAIAAEEAERAALARRFGLIGIAKLEAKLTLSRRGDDIAVHGRLAAAVTQACVATAEPVAAEVDAPLEILFRPQPDPAEDEIELSESEMDVVFLTGSEIDVGEAVAETLALALDPYPRAPDADDALKAAGVKSEEEAGPFAALAGLRDKMSK